MYLTRLSATGLRHVPELLHLERHGTLPAAPQATAIGDAARLLQVALAPQRFALLDQLGWLELEGEVLGDEDEIDMLLGLSPVAVDCALDGPTRSIAIDVSIAPDPPLYGRLREHAVRDPRLVTALGQQAELHVKAGFLFTADRTAATPDLLGARVGDVSFPIAGKERPAWLPGLLADLATKLFVLDLLEPIDDVVDRLAAAATSHRPDARAAWRRAVEALTAPPFDLPEPGWMTGPDGLELVFGPSLVDLRHMGREAVDAVRWVEAVLVHAPDVLLVTEPVSEPLRDWLHRHTEGDDATLEQVLVP